MNRYLAALLLGCALAVTPAAATDKYVIHDDQPMDDARRPAPGKALIYFVRTQVFGLAIKFKLYVDGKFIGLIQSQTFVPVEVDPGKHEFVATSENAGFLEAEVAPNKIYIVQVAVHMGAWRARTHFEVARTGSEAMNEFMPRQVDLRAVTTTDEGLAWVKETDKDIQGKIAKFRARGEEFETLKPEDGFDTPPWIK